MNSSRSISWFLVRYGRLQRVGWFGTVHDLPLKRHSEVLVETIEGEWLGVVLQTIGRMPPIGQKDGPGLRRQQRPTGEILRSVTAEDYQSALLADEVALSLRQAVDRHVGADLAVIETDVSIDRRVGCIQFLGTPSETLGRWAVQLAEAHDLQRVQWIEGGVQTFLKPTPSSQPIGDPQPTAFDRQASTGGEVEAARTEGANESPLFPWIQMIHNPGACTLGPTAKQFRRELGLMGLYLQKVSGDRTNQATQQTPRLHSSPPTSVRQWMLRLRFAGGRLLTSQFLGLLDLASELAHGSLRMTMRQGLQLHGVLPEEVGDLLARLDRLALSTRGSCGDAVRNVSCCPLTPKTAAAKLAQQIASQLTHRWLPQANWCELAIDPTGPVSGEVQAAVSSRRDDLAYPNGYPPHKWKIGVATGDDNCVNVLINDLALIVRPHQATPQTLLVDCYIGGGLAYRPGEPRSFPQLALPLGSVLPNAVEPLTEILLEIYRQFFHEESDFKISNVGAKRRFQRRWKHVVASLGIETLRLRVEKGLLNRGYPMMDCDPEALVPWKAHRMWEPDGQGGWDWTVPVPAGRILPGVERIPPDHGIAGLEEGCQAMSPRFFSVEDIRNVLARGKRVSLGPRHCLVVHNVNSDDRSEIEGDSYWEAQREGRSLRVLTCVARPTCPFALAESERDLGRWAEAMRRNRGRLQASLADFGGGDDLTIAISGCGNGCSHSMTADIGIVAEGVEQFHLFLGGNGVRLGTPFGVFAGPDDLDGLLEDE